MGQWLSLGIYLLDHSRNPPETLMVAKLFAPAREHLHSNANSKKRFLSAQDLVTKDVEWNAFFYLGHRRAECTDARQHQVRRARDISRLVGDGYLDRQFRKQISHRTHVPRSIVEDTDAFHFSISSQVRGVPRRMSTAA